MSMAHAACMQSPLVAEARPRRWLRSLLLFAAVVGVACLLRTLAFRLGHERGGIGD